MLCVDLLLLHSALSNLVLTLTGQAMISFRHFLLRRPFTVFRAFFIKHITFLTKIHLEICNIWV